MAVDPRPAVSTKPVSVSVTGPPAPLELPPPPMVTPNLSSPEMPLNAIPPSPPPPPTDWATIPSEASPMVTIFAVLKMAAVPPDPASPPEPPNTKFAEATWLVASAPATPPAPPPPPTDCDSRPTESAPAV